MRFFRYSFLTVLTIALASSQAFAALELDLKQGSGNGFGYSYLHDADGTGAAKNTNGEKVKLGIGTNAVLGQLDTINEVLKILGTEPDPLDHDALTAANGSETVVMANSLKFTGGVLSVKNGTFGGGYIDYQYTDDVGPVTGTFYFNDVKETGSGIADGKKPNSGDVTGGVVNIAEWGNNWMYDDGNAGTSLADEWGFLALLSGSKFVAADFDAEGKRDLTYVEKGNRLGLDLRATGVIPEPMSLAIWGGLIAVFGLRRRRSI